MTDPFCSTDLVNALVYCGFWYWQWTATSPRSRQWYDSYRQRVALAPPGWLFGVMWAVIFSLLGVSTYLYARNFQSESFFTATMWILLANALANKLWSTLFFDMSRVALALFLLALFVFPTAVLIPVFMALDGAYVSFGLWLLYPTWLLVAIYLNWNWFRSGFPTKDEPAASLPVNQPAPKPSVVRNMSGVMILGYDDPNVHQRSPVFQ